MSSQTTTGQDVSMMALGLYIDFADARGDDGELVLRGLDITREDIAQRKRWISVEELAQVERNLARLYPDEDNVHYLAGRSLGEAKGPVMVSLVRTLFSPTSWYALLPRVVPKIFFRYVKVELTRRGRRELDVLYVFDEGYSPTQAWIDTCAGILVAVPLMMGVSEPDLSVEQRADGAVRFSMVFTNAWLGPTDWIKQLFHRITQGTRNRLLGFRSAGDELVQTNQLLEDKISRLQATEVDLDRRVRHLGILHAVTQAANSELALGALVDKAVLAIHAELEVGVAILLGDGVEDAFAVNAEAGLSDLDRHHLAEALSTWGDRPPNSPRLSGNGHVHWISAHEKRLGGLVVFAEYDEHSQQLCESLAAQLSTAIANASSYQEVVELRDNLEARVIERTAALASAHHELQLTVDKLEAADRATRDFFTNVSHEFRTPLTLILAPLEALLADLGPENQGARRMVDGIRRNAHSLLHLINEILDFARLDAEQMPCHPEPIELCGFVRELVDSLQEMAGRAQISLGVETPGHGVPVQADPRLLRRAYGNLLVNAIKYINAGDAVTLRLTVRETDQRVVVEVLDTGPGIPEDRHETVFERFRRLEDGKGNVATGTGIGLAMVRAILEMHSGSIRLTNNTGGGARFISEVPLDIKAVRENLAIEPSLSMPDPEAAFLAHAQAQRPTPTFDEIPQAEAHAPRVLLVEDNPDMRRFVADLLCRDYQVFVASNGEEGLDKAAEVRPDLIVSDVQMPRMNGYDMCRALKADPETANVPVMLVSAMHGNEASVQGFAAGADDFVVKPFSPPELMARIGAQIKLRRLQQAMIRMERQTTLGVMAGGIAHEVLNPVNAVLVAMRPLRSQLSELPAEKAARAERLLEVVQNAGERIRDVVKSVLTLSRQDGETPQWSPFNVRDGLNSVLQVLEHRMQDIELEVELPDDDEVRCVPELMLQALTNLCSNAIDAMPDGGLMRVVVARSDDELVIRVIDSGPGVERSIRSRIFIPFFTTKAPGKGTGLGLAITKEIAELHGGKIRVEDTLEGGAFRLEIPAARPAIRRRETAA